jgi:hypothetical protein
MCNSSNVANSGVNPGGWCRDPPDFEVGGRGGGLGVVEGVVSDLLRSKGEGREPRTPPVFKPD